ncbi:FxsA family protein [Devosia aurantiaca]|uniref:FxsA family protein n=1 Tax=Devosia aurantiaca TaxID=2714858 RepID=A0A6M1SA98_9HYPH|nr:FxsA family protein [Devosia aurantiaca]NGP16727.1 FxsA family protein [Devosia aurantiaca]
MIRLLPLGFLLLPLVEIALFIIVGRAIGLFPTLALVIGAALLGVVLLRQQGLGVLSRMRSNLGAGTLPGRELFDAMLIGLAALFLVLPGFLSDIVALLLLVPGVRGWIFSSLARRVTVVDTGAYRRYSAEDGRLQRPTTIDLDNDDWRDGRQ